MTASQQTTILGVLPDAVRRRLLEQCETVAFAAGEEVVRAGEPGDAYFVISDGSAEVLGPMGHSLAVLGPGDGFGELALLLERPRTATVVARRELRCLRVTAERFHALVNEPEWLLRIAASLAARQADDNARLQDALIQLKQAYTDTVSALAAAVEARDPYTGGHVERCGALCRLLSYELDLSPEEQELAELAGALHDVGKLAVPDAILRKPDKLTIEERSSMRRHAEAGARLVGRIEYLAAVAPVIQAHHESWDGSGYPNGLRGDAIPIGACIISVADTYDAITTTRPYRVGQSAEVAIEEIKKYRGTQFHPGVVDALVRLHQRGALS